MKVLLIIDRDIQVNMSTPVLNEKATIYSNVDLTFEVNPGCLKKAIVQLRKKYSGITEIITTGECRTERRFRAVYADTIAFLEKEMNVDKAGLPQVKKPSKNASEVTGDDSRLQKDAETAGEETDRLKSKQRLKCFLKYLSDYWSYIKNKTYFKKKITVFSSEYGFVFTAGGIDYIALEKADEVTIPAGENILKDRLNKNSPVEIKEFPSTVSNIIHSNIPLRTDKAPEIFRKTVRNVAVVAFVVAGVYLLYNSVYKSVENTVIQSEIQSIYYDGEVSREDKKEDYSKNFKKLHSINEEIAAWVAVDHTNIDYPVMFHKGDTLKSQYYLYNNYEKNQSEYGSIFIDFRCQQGAKSKNVVMHGHHMMDGSMFSNLLKYGKTSIDMDFYKKSPTITFSTPEGTDVYKIISVYKTTGDKTNSDFFNYIQGDFTGDAEFLNYVYNVRVRSMVNCPVDINEDDTLITLSTCSYEPNSNYRTVVTARKTRDGESPKVDTADATKNSRAYFPSDFYYRYGGTQPKITSFKTEYKKGNIDWYDGDGKFKGKETLTGGKFVRSLTTTQSSTEKTSSTKGTSTTKKEAAKPKKTKPKTTKPKATKARATAPKPTEPKIKYYTVKFTDAYGRVIKTQRVKEGSSAKAPPAPKKAPSKTQKYIFVKWNKSYGNVRRNLTVRPVYKKVKIQQAATQAETIQTTSSPPLEPETGPDE